MSYRIFRHAGGFVATVAGGGDWSESGATWRWAAGRGGGLMGGDGCAPLLVVFSGLPGSGKTTLARGLADELQATFLRIDTIEAAIASTLTPFEGNAVGYVAAQWLAQDQLVAGRSVVVDACNNLVIARRMWTDLADRLAADLRWVEVICSDAAEHRRRVEQRRPDWPGQGNPSWIQVQNRTWEPFEEPRLLIDNVGTSAAHVSAILEKIVPVGELKRH